MKPWLAAALILATALPAGALARDHGGHGEGRGRGGWSGEGRDGGWRGEDRGPGWRGEGRGWRDRDREDFRGRPQWGGESWRGGRFDRDRRDWIARRGGRLPPGWGGEPVPDYWRYHLRRPPPGYVWYRDGDDYVLAAIASGLIFDIITGGD